MYGTGNGLSAANDHYFTQNSSGVDGVSGVGDEFGAFVTTSDINDDGFRTSSSEHPEKRISSRNNAGAVHVLYGTNNGTTTPNDTFLYVSQSLFRGQQPKQRTIRYKRPPFLITTSSSEHPEQPSTEPPGAGAIYYHKKLVTE
ncbi:MAG: hypothetical protein Ct9H90mP30_5570 [Actinomycetota bacterium]|nr:MAG: hypothetical protein Ct9H90mP30_5570 [Actinomycetota bacterium]